MGQSLSRCVIHVVFSTKNRHPLLSSIIRPRLHQYLGGLLKHIHCHPMIINGTEDHMHIMCELAKDVTQKELVRYVKVATSKWIKPQSSELRSFQWQAGYGLFSVSRSQEKYGISLYRKPGSASQKNEFSRRVQGVVAQAWA
jgi:putative transposase